MLVKTAIGEIRRGLGRPHDAELSDPDIIMELWQAISLYRANLNMSNQPWQIKRLNVDIPAGATEKVITCPDLGQAFMMRTVNTGNPYFIGRTVDIVRPEQMSMYWSGPENTPMIGSYSRPHVAVVFTLFREASSWKLMWAPSHQESCRYQLWYTTGQSVIPPLFDSALGIPAEEQSSYIVAECVINLMPHLADPEKGLNPKQQVLLQAAERKVQQWIPIIEARKWDGPYREPTTRRKVFGQSRSSARGGDSGTY